ncbi:hypothetical protein LTR53_009844 [Teratosphaeriaceae sp. CCFEE 6253]|nr:hypothetical protein LTR53_009844 [Teratosphaeriaceae sp. CCFEE 6253]
MAETIGVASGVLTLAAFAFKSSVSLYQTTKSFRSHLPRVRDLVDETAALSGVLSSLNEMVHAIADVDMSALSLPLLRCGKACKDFEDALLKCSSRSTEERTSFRDLAKLKYMGEDLDGFRRLLTGYKLTISIALTDANLRRSSATAESLEVYSDLLNTARADLEDRLEMIDQKLQMILSRASEEPGVDGPDVTVMREERLSTEQGLHICARLSEHIRQIQVTNRGSDYQDDSSTRESSPHKLTMEGLRECRDSLARTALRLKGHETQLFHRMVETSKTRTSSKEEQADLVRLQDEWEATRQGIDICTKADGYLQGDASTIDNCATGDAVQIMVSTTEKTIHGKNRGLGWRTRQIGGHISDEALKQIALSLGSVKSPSPEPMSPSPAMNTASGEGRDSFRGKGFQLRRENDTKDQNIDRREAEVRSRKPYK